MHTDVIIIGAGPTGLTLATNLAMLGVDFIIIDKKSGITELSKALGIQARTLELFDDLNIVEPFLEKGKITGSVSLFIRGKKRGGFDLSSVGEGMSPFPYMLSLPQNITEEILCNRLSDYNRIVEWNTELLDITKGDDIISATIKRDDDTTSQIHGKYLVGCDGGSSFVRKRLGLNFEGDTLGKYFYVLDTKIEWDIEHSDMYACLCKDTFVAFIPMVGEKRYRVIGILPKSIENPDDTSLQEIVERIKIDSEIPCELSEIKWHSVYKVHTRKADRFIKGNCFIAGDAAHVHTPAGGQGMNTGIQDAYNLAWKLNMVINHNADKKLLETYDSEREMNAQDLLNTTDKSFEIQAGDGIITSFIRMNIFPRLAKFMFGNKLFKKKLFPVFSQIGIKYPDSTLTVSNKIGKVESGDRLPYFKMEDGNSIYEILKEPKHHLLTLEGSEDYNLPSYIIQKKISSLPQSVFGKNPNVLILLRPDNYISYIGTDFNEIIKFIKTVYNTA